MKQIFILDEQMEKVINPKIKKDLEEVVSSFNNGNYRACVNVLYTTVIYDLVDKMLTLKNIYNDQGAEKIITDIMNSQTNNPTSPAWENNLIENICKYTSIISDVEKEELLYLKQTRNFAAHPIINIDDDKLSLKQITKETAADLIRKAFEIVFLRDAILAKDLNKDIVKELNEYYSRVGNKGLDTFLKSKYFNRMTQERKDYLFKALWKFTFILENDNTVQNRESNFWGLLYLYKDNRDHYIKLISEDQNYYLNKLEIETFESWSKPCSDYEIYNFKKYSRIIYLVKFIEYSPEIYYKLNDYSKNILKQSIENMYASSNIVEKELYQFDSIYYQDIERIFDKYEVFKEQVLIQSRALFLCNKIEDHFNLIFTMIYNYMKTADSWSEPSHYDILDESDIDIIFHQASYMNCVDDFLKFLIKYCTDANLYYQANKLFNYLKNFKNYYNKEHYYSILSNMNNNSQFYDNPKKYIMLNELNNMFEDSFKNTLVETEEEQFLYSKLYSTDKSNIDVDKLFKILEERALYFTPFAIEEIIRKASNEIRSFLKQKSPDSYPNIKDKLTNSEYKYHLEIFLNLFK